MPADSQNPFLTGTKPPAREAAVQVETVPADGPAIESVDAVILVNSDQGHVVTEMEINAPLGDGADATMEDILAALEKKGIVYGLDKEALETLAEPTYGKKMVVARATAAVDGEDGTCTELFPRTVHASFTEREDGTVDYKELGLIQQIEEGTAICEVTLPVPGIDGTNTQGKPIRAREGKKAVVPAGENTRMSEDGLRLVATATGNLVFRNGRFTVDKVYRVENVDYDVGNITFSGDVVVNGDMHDGFEIHAGGNVTLRGRVGAVVVETPANLIIEKGINGTGRALLDVGGVLKAGFIENCNLKVGEAISAQSVINCQVECEGDIDVSGGKGIICGGKVTAFGSVKAKEIGNESNTLTVVALGVTPKLLKERKRLVDQLADVTKHIDELTKNVEYIERLVADGRPVPPERVQLLKRTQIQLPMTEKKREQLNAAIKEIEDKMANVNTSTLTARTIYPPTKVSIGALSGNVIETRNNCRVYKSKEGELVFGSA